MALALAAAPAAVLAGCGGGDESPDSDNAEATSETTELPDPIRPSGAERVPISERLVTRIQIGDAARGPDWMVSAFGSLWVKRDDGIVVRIDPESSRVIAEIGKPGPLGHVCQGIGASAEAIWSCPPSDRIERIDPATEAVESINVEKIAEQGRIASAAGRVWVLTGDGAKLTAIDPQTNEPKESFDLGGRCGDLAAEGDTLWVTCPLEDKILRFDAARGEVDDELELPRVTNAAVGTELWAGFYEGLAQIDPQTLEVLAVYELYPSYGGSIFAGRDAVWVREEGGSFLSRIDPKAERIVEQIKAPDLPSGGDVVQIGDSVWATAYDDATVVELTATPR